MCSFYMQAGNIVLNWKPPEEITIEDETSFSSIDDWK